MHELLRSKIEIISSFQRIFNKLEVFKIYHLFYLLLKVTAIFILCWVLCFWGHNFRRLLIHKSQYKRLNFKMDFPPIILPAGSEFAYSKMFACFFHIFPIMNTSNWLLAIHNCRLEHMPHKIQTDALGPLWGLFGTLCFKQNKIQKMCISGSWHMAKDFGTFPASRFQFGCGPYVLRRKDFMCMFVK